MHSCCENIIVSILFPSVNFGHSVVDVAVVVTKAAIAAKGR